MNKYTERLREIMERKATLSAELKAETAPTEERVAEIKEEGDALTAEERSIIAQMEAAETLQPEQRGAMERGNAIEQRAAGFAQSGHLTLPGIVEGRSILVSSGKLATPVTVSREIGSLPVTEHSIVDDVKAVPANGTGTHRIPYLKTGAVAANHTEGAAYAGTEPTYDYIDVAAADWGVLSEISAKTAQMTPVDYMQSVQDESYLALRDMAGAKIVAAVLGSTLAETKLNVALDADYLRTIVLGYKAPKRTPGSPKLYLTRNDLTALCKIRGTGEKKALYEVTFTDDANVQGVIREGGFAVNFALDETLTDGVQLYGKPMTIEMPMWGNYEVSTDDSGDYFKRKMIGIRADAQANAELNAWHGMQIIKQASA